jgi:hypothetical protein
VGIGLGEDAFDCGWEVVLSIVDGDDEGDGGGHGEPRRGGWF